MTSKKTQAKKGPKRPKKAPKTAVGIVLLGAARRLELNPDQEDCVCAQRGADETPRHSPEPFPSAEAGRWCPFCAIEAEQRDQEEPPQLYGEALKHLAFEIDAEVYEAGEEVERDSLILGWWEEQPIEAILETFAAAVARIEAPAHG